VFSFVVDRLTLRKGENRYFRDCLYLVIPCLSAARIGAGYRDCTAVWLHRHCDVRGDATTLTTTVWTNWYELMLIISQTLNLLP
jgi:hypothetical protein